MLAALSLNWMVPLVAQDMAGRDVLRRTLEARGGVAALARIKTLHASGRVDAFRGYPGPYESWATTPNRMVEAWEVPVYNLRRGFDGEVGWESHGWPPSMVIEGDDPQNNIRELGGMALRRLARTAVFDPLLSHWESETPVRVEAVRIAPLVAELGSSGGGEFRVRTGDGGLQGWMLVFEPASGLTERFYIDGESFLPVRTIRAAEYEEGVLEISVEYSDYREVQGVMLPFTITRTQPDLPITILVEEYQLNERIDLAQFESPSEAYRKAPYAVSLATIPETIYAVPEYMTGTGWSRSWGIPLHSTRYWNINILVREEHGRWVEPISATVDFYAGSKRVGTREYSRDYLMSVKKFPVGRLGTHEELYNFGHHFGGEPEALGVDRMTYTLQVNSPHGEVIESTLDIPIVEFEQKTELIFPLKGTFTIITGHEHWEYGHKDEQSQYYAWDIVGLRTEEGEGGDTTYTFGWYDRGNFGQEVMAPAAGTVVFARNDIPDEMLQRDYLKLPNPNWSIGGNSVIIDHGNGEYSCLFHLQLGSVRVKIGDRVSQGEVVGQLGAPATVGHPHLHYQLQAGPGLFRHDGLPARFGNVVEWLGGEKVEHPKRGGFYIAGER